MNGPKSSKASRGTTMLEIQVSILLLVLIFLFLSADLIQSSHAENVSATRTETMNAANYMLGVMRDDGLFWQTDWALGPEAGTLKDPCGNIWPPYTDTMTAPNWHPAPACTPDGTNPGVFPDMIGVNSFKYMWNAQQQGTDPNTATLTVWVQINENGNNIYELTSTKTHLVTPATILGSAPTPTPTPTPTPCPTNCKSPSPTPTPSPKPSASATIKPSPTPTPSPSPKGTFE
jgi:hypothetical protein